MILHGDHSSGLLKGKTSELKVIISKSIYRGEKSQIPSERQSKVFHYYPTDEKLQDTLGVKNSYLPYCFLVHNGLIRWKAMGEPKELEVNGLLSVTKKLLAR
jgi:hypothetical protein